MKPAIALTLVLSLNWAAVSSAQRDDRISLWADDDRTYCGLIATPGIVSVYMFHTGSEPASALQFSAPKPECWRGATWMADVITSGFLAIGNSQTDLSIAYTGPVIGCLQPPIYLGRIDYVVSDSTPSCCVYRVAPAPTSPPAIWVADCHYQVHEVFAGSGVTINPNSSCPCHVGPPPPPPPPPPSDPTITLYADRDMASCALFDAAGVRSIHIFHTGSPSATGSQFAAPLPACWSGATWVGDHIEPPFLSLGNSQTDLSIAYAGCVEPPLYLGRIYYLSSGTSKACCEHLPRAVAGEPGVWIADCDYETHALPAGAGVMINPIGDCPCGETPVSVQETTWGRIKAMYSNR